MFDKYRVQKRVYSGGKVSNNRKHVLYMKDVLKILHSQALFTEIEVVCFVVVNLEA